MAIVKKVRQSNGKKPLIGFIGQGWIGKAYSDILEERGYMVVRYSLEKPYIQNKDKIKECDIVFIAVWTPTTPKGFDISVVDPEAFAEKLKAFFAGERFPAVLRSYPYISEDEYIHAYQADLTACRE